MAHGPGPAFPAPNPQRVASAFRNVLSMVGAAKERGPRQVAGSSDTFLAEVCVPGGRRCEAVLGLRIWGCGRVSRPLAHLLRLPLEGLFSMSEIFVF